MKRKRTSKPLCCLMLLGLLLGLYKGRLALWKNQDPVPVKIFPYSASQFPAPLQQALQKGIPIDSMEDLENLLEKYLP